MMRITIEDEKYTAVADVNAGYDAALMMSRWDEQNFYWWAYQIKRVGLQGKIADALAKWDDDSSTGVVCRILKPISEPRPMLDNRLTKEQIRARLAIAFVKEVARHPDGATRGKLTCVIDRDHDKARQIARRNGWVEYMNARWKITEKGRAYIAPVDR